MKTIHLSAKCSDLFSAFLREGPTIVGEYTGYVPEWFPNPKAQNDGDYVILEIDIEQGRILNWRKPTPSNLKIFTQNPS